MLQVFTSKYFECKCFAQLVELCDMQKLWCNTHNIREFLYLHVLVHVYFQMLNLCTNYSSSTWQTVISLERFYVLTCFQPWKNIREFYYVLSSMLKIKWWLNEYLDNKFVLFLIFIFQYILVVYFFFTAAYSFEVFEKIMKKYSIKCKNNLADQGIDCLATFCTMTESDFKKIGLTTGDSKKCAIVAKLITMHDLRQIRNG